MNPNLAIGVLYHWLGRLGVRQFLRSAGAAVIGTESTGNVLRAYGVPEEQVLTVRGGEDYQFNSFSLKVIPSIHSPLDHKHYFSSATAPTGMKAPLTLEQIHPERYSRLPDSFSQSSNSRVWRHELHRTRDRRTGASRRIDHVQRIDTHKGLRGNRSMISWKPTSGQLHVWWRKTPDAISSTA